MIIYQPWVWALSNLSLLLLSLTLTVNGRQIVLESRAPESDIHSLAQRHDFTVVKRFLDNLYVLEMKRNDERQDHDEHIRSTLENLNKNEHVRWADRDHVKGYSKRGFVSDASDIYMRAALEPVPEAEFVPEVPDFNDPLFPEQWYYQSEGQSGIVEGSDHSIIDVWKMGFNGKGVKVVVIDDGLDGTHHDLRAKFNATISYDFNNNVSDPQPRIDEKDPEFNAHGTKCAGQIAAQPNNGVCGVGIAYGAQIGGNKILDGKVTDSMEGDAFSHHCEEVDIYSMSWGPTDDGKTYGGFMKVSYEAVKHCIKHGRKGLGSIYVWASGNGGAHGDCCNADSLISSFYTVAIGALTHEGKPAYFQETCPSILASVYTGGVSKLQMRHLKNGGRLEKSHPMVTTNIMFDKQDPTSLENCEEYFSGTSAAGPLGAGMIALMLQANPKLNWRDVQHIIVETSDQPNPKSIPSEDDGKWALNGDGRTVSHDLGFGVMNAAKMVMTAQNWTTVPAWKKCTVATFNDKRKIVNMKEGEVVYKMPANCKKVRILEYVVVDMSMNASYRGAVIVKLTSPSGFTSVLMKPRPKDNSTDAIEKWPYPTVLHWGEQSEGEWTLTVSYDPSVLPSNGDQGDDVEKEYEGEISLVRLILYGTETRHVNPSKSNPKLANQVTGHERASLEVIKEQFKDDAENSDLIGILVEDSISKREEENLDIMAGLEAFRDPNEGRVYSGIDNEGQAFGTSPRDKFPHHREDVAEKRTDDESVSNQMGDENDFKDKYEDITKGEQFSPRFQ